jgi:mono/diheme cytochrome c family protein
MSLRGGALPPKQSPHSGIASGKEQERPRNDMKQGNQMNLPQNRIRLFEMLAGLLATQLIVFGLAFYMLNEPTRIVTAQTDILHTQLDDAMTLYAENCSVCHGLAGEGIGANPALNNPALQTMPYDDLAKTIERGRFNTAMPAWSKEDGGPLSDYQISELVNLIQSGDWNATQDRVVPM